MKKHIGDLKENQFYLNHIIFDEWIHRGMDEIICRFNLKVPSGYPNYTYYYFVKKNSNRYFRKHLGFTYNRLRYYRHLCNNFSGLITVVDYKKLMLFKLKYDL